MELWFVRHGESESNIGLRDKGLGEAPLTPLGLRQAQAFADTFEGPPKAIYTSHFVRAQMTAAPSSARWGVPAQVRAIQEFTFLNPTKYANTTFAERAKAVRAYYATATPDTVDGPGAESLNGLFSRVDAFLDEIAVCPGDGTILAFSHGRFMKAVMARLQVDDAHTKSLRAFIDFAEKTPVLNTGVLKLGHSKAGWYFL